MTRPTAGELQIEYNRRHGIVPTTIVKDVHDLIEATYAVEEGSRYDVKVPKQGQILKVIADLENAKCGYCLRV